MSEIKVVEKPLTPKEVRALADEDGYIRVVVPVPLYDVINADGIEGMNDTVDDLLFAGGDFLGDLNFRAVGVRNNDNDRAGEVLVEVHGQPNSMTEDLDDDDTPDSR
jgi:hypothetical protein